MRVGMGYDVHKLTQNRKLILGGVDIPHSVGLLGHSDADVLLHAIMDALLGAAALGDIGQHFPDTDEKYKGASSLDLLKQVGVLLEDACYVIGNIDATIIAQAPKMAPFIPQMRENVAKALGIEISQVNIKATTEEGLGLPVRKRESHLRQSVCWKKCRIFWWLIRRCLLVAGVPDASLEKKKNSKKRKAAPVEWPF